ncbi:hypothetical protein [Roseovarius atlanticus]|uniref:hypothetical protein n=1 Tax=Roseovarius atlanticus TaxID=1641875 RepID=UPI001C966BAA|nr:hypothetical protein [Roseovarius atlanticus]MBY5988197.1 hypothetical protein [Roseovarius atlanticus]MBY6123588.1 hypothetical protein [Roseovarius atlanticus]MBY6148083.1 hypothetical protein [Roseovarius atlanticus]
MNFRAQTCPETGQAQLAFGAGSAIDVNQRGELCGLSLEREDVADRFLAQALARKALGRARVELGWTIRHHLTATPADFARFMETAAGIASDLGARVAPA